MSPDDVVDVFLGCDVAGDDVVLVDLFPIGREQEREGQASDGPAEGVLRWKLETMCFPSDAWSYLAP